MYDAPFLAIALLLLMVYRQLCHAMDKMTWWGDPNESIVAPLDGPAQALLPGKHRRTWWKDCLRVLFHYYTPLYSVIVLLVVEQLFSTCEMMTQTDWLDPHKLRAAVASEPDLPDWWENEIQHMISDKTSWLRWFSLSSPVFMVLTLLVSVANTHRHVQICVKEGGGMEGNDGHDNAIVIIALPVVYCTLACRSASRMLQVCANAKDSTLAHIVDFQGQQTWEARLVMAQLLYKTNLSVADLYEAWALYQFAWLTLAVIRAESKRLFREIKTDKAIQEAATKEHESLEKLTVQGIYLFIISCLLESIYYVFTTTVETVMQQGARKFEIEVWTIKEQVHFFFLGMGTIASSAAISNVVTVELAFHETLTAFRPAAKFWSTKVLVSIAFLQSLALLVWPLNTLSVTEQLLFYASALCVECFFVSLLHWIAWMPNEEWYGCLSSHVRVEKARKASLKHK